jgi:predicted DNA-binding transcriptional regulator YafY
MKYKNTEYREQRSKIDYIQRYLAIIRCFRKAGEKQLTKEEIRNYIEKQFANQNIFGIGSSDKTLTRDFKEISRLGYNIYNENNSKYYKMDCSFDYKIEDILDSFYILNSIGGDSGKPDFIHSEKRPYTGTEHFVPLKEAIHECKIVQFDYTKYYPEETKIRFVEPYALKESRGRWYLLGFEKGKYQKSKAFCFDRISDLFVTTVTFNKKTNIDWESKYEHCFAMFTSEKPPIKVVLSFDKRDAHYITSKPIHQSQTPPRYDGERVFFELFIEITEDFKMELMSRCWSLEVHEPLVLRQEMFRLFQEAAKRNNPD